MHIICARSTLRKSNDVLSSSEYTLKLAQTCLKKAIQLDRRSGKILKHARYLTEDLNFLHHNGFFGVDNGITNKPMFLG